jgi:hypothetical protein
MFDADVWVSAEFQRLAEIINQYDQNLFLEWIPPEAQLDLNDKSKVFRIVDDRTKTIVMYADSLSNPTSILERLWSMDAAHHDVVAKMDAHNAAVEALKNQEQIEKRMALKDFSAFVLKNEKSRWTHEGKAYNEHFQDLGPTKKTFS